MANTIMARLPRKHTGTTRACSVTVLSVTQPAVTVLSWCLQAWLSPADMGPGGSGCRVQTALGLKYPCSEQVFFLLQTKMVTFHFTLT